MTVIYIAGSFRSGPEKSEAQDVLERAGIRCLVSSPGDPQGIKGCLEHISAAHAVYVVNPGGRVGKSVCVDIGYALALDRPVYPQSPVEDPPVAELLEDPISANELAARLTRA